MGRFFVFGTMLLAAFCAAAPGFAALYPTHGMLVTFNVTDWRAGTQPLEFKAVFTRPDATTYLSRYAQGQAALQIPHGTARAGREFNAPWSWHLESDTLKFSERAAAACDAALLDVEKNFARPTASSRRFCPSTARIIRVERCDEQGCVRLPGLYAGRSPF